MRGMKWLLVALVAVAGIWGALEIRGRSKSSNQPLYPDFKPQAAEKITLTSPQGGAVLEKEDGVWIVSSEDSFPAEAIIVRDMLATIAAFSRKDRISSNPEKRALYQVDSTGTWVTVEDGRAKVMASVIVGRTGADYQSTYVRDSGSNDVIIAQGGFSHIFNRGKRSWQDKRLFDVEPDLVSEVGMTAAGRTTVVRRGGDGAWYISAPESAACDQNKVSGLVRALASLRCEDFAGRAALPEWGVDNPDSSLYLKTEAGEQRTLLIGHKGEGDRFYAATRPGGPVYLLAPRSVRAVLPPPADLLPRQETPAGESQP